ncbi:hypothetical protein GCM10011487_55850 [Steroidobacter agaridevorans]|uniref:Uncharacterized protein n=1 Tax=Steroidobacter agaridevorans TaxID=2695856 RepID=A0A829YJV5_9GAMM|nr:hypothetical protein [Steroidobacter agaridevorans]GFE83585.1 hypothetical protein GCM10011487_55850 [Steroidobacter agaridevorans]GFE86533.1 hypothetical protein GCM10011488_14870 [Steroidobacter agaridevorans]
MRIRTYLGSLMCIVGASAYAGGDPIPVCVGPGGAMRLIEMKVTCKAGEQKKLFAEWEAELDEPPEEEDARMENMQKQLQEMTKRLAALEKNSDNRGSSQAATRITAPFEVVGRTGKVILRVADKVSSTSGEGAQVTIGAGDAGNYGVRVYKDGATFVAGVGQARGGAGLVAVMDENGSLVASMSARDRSVSVYEGDKAAASLVLDDTGGTVAIYQGSQAVAYLTRSSHGNGGNVTLTDGKGFGVFSAGAASDGGGEACLNRVTGGGKQRNVCLGIELPSMGLGK